MNVSNWRPIVTGLLAALFAQTGLAAAQSNERIYEELSFRSMTPGARAVGMGNTFVGLSDDATAALSNPAGLSNLLAQEMSVQFDVSQIHHRRLIGLDAARVPITQPFGDVVASPSFISYVAPFKNYTLSLFMNTLQEYRERYQIQPRAIPGLGPGVEEDGAFGNISAHLQQYGVGLSYVVNRYASVGASAVWNTADVSESDRSGDPQSPRNGTDTIDHATRWSGLVGVLVKPYKGVAVGASFNRGATFHMTTRLSGVFIDTGIADTSHGPWNVCRSTPAVGVLANAPPLVLTNQQCPFDYVVPDRYSLGASWRANDHWTVVMDAAKIMYSQLITSNFLIVDFLDPAAGLTPSDYSIRDVYEFHGGGEFAWFRRSATYALRAGAFSDPSHTLEYHRRSAISDAPIAAVADAIENYQFNSVPPSTALGVTAGFGVVLKNKVRIDFAGSHTRNLNQFVMSLVLRIGS